MDVEKLDVESVAWPRAADRDRSAEWVQSLQIELGQGAHVRARPDLLVADVPGPHDHGVPGIHDENRLVGRVPRVMDVIVA
jgi:hypothetical protein